MTREQVKSLLPIIIAFAEGKTIEVANSRGNWSEINNPVFDGNPENYRIKPEPKYRPFNNAEECWQEMQKHSPFGWLKLKVTGKYFILKAVGDFSATVGLNNSPTDYYELFKDYAFADGTPFGVIVNE